jgi:hypothetical protein
LQKFVIVDSAAATACDVLVEETAIGDDCWYGRLDAALITGTINDGIPPPWWGVTDAEDDGATKLA